MINPAIILKFQQRADKYQEKFSQHKINDEIGHTGVISFRRNPEIKENNGTKKRCVIGRILVESELNKLLENEQNGKYTLLPSTYNNAYPTLLARLPIFSELNKSNHNNSASFNTPFGKGTVFGQPLSMPHESLFLALLQLSQKVLIGKAHALPIPIKNYNWLKNEHGLLTVQICACTVNQLLKKIGLSTGGLNRENTLKRLKDLSRARITINTGKKERYFGSNWAGEQVNLIDINWQKYKSDGVILAQFPPIIVKWLQEEKTFYNYKVRQQFSSGNALALFKFLSTQGNRKERPYKASLTYIADAIGWKGNRLRLKSNMEAILVELRDVHDWCYFEITGTGRTTPFILTFQKRQKNKPS